MVSNNRISITTPPGLVSIVIPCCRMLDYTRLCVPSVLRHSRAPFELIFLDIGSLDGTAEYLAGLRDGLSNRVRVEICRAATDLSIPDPVTRAAPRWTTCGCSDITRSCGGATASMNRFCRA